jgi:hypothetical protein
MKKSPREQLWMIAKLLALMLQMKDVVEQQKLEERSGEGVHPNVAASAVIGGEFNFSTHTIAVLMELRGIKDQIASTLERSEAK